MNRRLAVALGALALLLVLATLATWESYRAFLARPLDVPTEGTTVLVAPGETVRTVIRGLEERGITQVNWQWRLLTRLNPLTIQVGEYALDAGMRPMDLLQRMAAGQVLQHRFTIVEGWNYRQLEAALLASDVLVVEPANLDPAVVMRRLGGNDESPEGWFLPETYAVVRGETGLSLLQRAHQAMQDALEQVWAGRTDGLPLATPYQLLILASIVEKEAGLAAERAAIAGVLSRRLQQGWKLEADPTVIYGLGEDFDGDLRSRDLRTDTPWNTYTRRGLPPTPIAMPGRATLQATAHPDGGHAMFFVADGKGGHVFSDTLAEHNQAVQALLRQQQK